MFISVDGKAKEVKEIFAGGSDGKAHKIKELFGSVNGIAKLIYKEQKETNAFDQFTWAEIKQLANEGKLLEHFSLHDKVTVKMKEPFSFAFKKIENNETKEYIRYQNEIVFQINELTATTMRLSSYHATIFGSWGAFDKKPKEWSSSAFRSYENVAWGLMPIYKYLKQIDTVLPEELREVLSGHRPLIEYTKYSTGQVAVKYDEDMKVRQMSVVNWKTQLNREDIPYTVDIIDTDFPLKKSEYLRYYNDDYSYQPGLGSTTSSSGSLIYKYYYDSSNSCYRFVRHTPRVSWDWDRSYDYYVDNPGTETLAANLTSYLGDVIPEILIEADE